MEQKALFVDLDGFKNEFEREIIDFVDERLVNEFTYSDWSIEIEIFEERIKKMLDSEIESLSDRFEFEILRLEKEFKQYVVENPKRKRSSWKWWK